jgi:prepilin-type processing-associated H-X9-DG protein
MLKKRPRTIALTLVEVLIVLALVATVALVLLMAVPRAREQARLAGCRRNLGQIGIAIALYDQFQNHLPIVAEPGPLDGQSAAGATTYGAGPLRTLLETLVLPDFTELIDPRKPLKPRAGEIPGETAVPGFVCQSDPTGLAGRFRAPVSYRATTGDSAEGDNGPFAPGRTLALSAIEAADGLSYTAGFAERLIGNHESGISGLAAYQLVPDRVMPQGCRPAPDTSAWRGDAGSSWRDCDYLSTLYNHALLPNGQPSCIAADGRTAFMGASSGHTRGVNMLLLDGSVTVVVPTINAKVWKEFASVKSRLSPAEP